MGVLEREYGALLSASAEPDYNVSMEIDLEQVPAAPGVGYVYSLYRSLKAFQRNVKHLLRLCHC